jgi:hypothetical protein
METNRKMHKLTMKQLVVVTLSLKDLIRSAIKVAAETKYISSAFRKRERKRNVYT